ncbi:MULTISPECIES: galactose ABC transporter substrate-binding protein [unclassified Clostridium]|uniref:galactose ABC transporter substrate-binding protein n=1 Tax=unclassified Clostridium TaxID=2614128 RepID=UPI0002972F00|nr:MULTISPECIES: galactose ABC transporter substrate-binding protein [unclassified Clostridium]EKQ52807.1 MAG: ABC-type sugar transport system, periplasmic component [Clostridium sp. Maddingley MBC34-26]
MKILRRILIIIILTVVSMNNVQNNIYAKSQTIAENPTRTAVILFSFDDPYISLVRKDLEKIKSKDNVNFTFYDGKRNQNIQNTIIDSVLQSNNYDLLLVNLVNLDRDTVASVVNKAKEKNVPIILFNTVPFDTQPIKSYSKALVISTDAKQSGILQGDLVVKEWNSNKQAMDINDNGTLEYILLKGPENITVTVDRSLYSISTINTAGIKTLEMLSKSCYWDEKCAESSMELLFLRYNGKIGAIISNNDAMAIGAIKALQKYGYNKGDKSKYIRVFGIDGIPEAIDFINKGFMTGTVFQDPTETAEALYAVGMNLVHNQAPLENTNYKFDETGVTIQMPYHEYKK